MKLQISFDLIDLDRAIDIATQVHEFADIIEIGTLLIYAHGITAVERFRETFPEKILLADTKIIDRGKESIALFAKAKSDWLTVMAGTKKKIIHAACSAAHEHGKKVMLDLIDAPEFGQSALEAKNLGADALLLHQPYDEQEPLEFLDKWEMVRGNTDLPLFISTLVKRDNIEKIMNLQPDGIVLGYTITEAEDPRVEAEFYYNLCKGIIIEPENDSSSDSE